MARRRRKSLRLRLFAGALVIGAAWYLATQALHLWRTPRGPLYAGLVAAAVLTVLTYRITRAVRRWRVLREVAVSDRREDYVITNEDYRRGTPREHLYRRVMQLSLLEIYENRCAKCGAQDNGVDLDHFIFSKNEGGTFGMRHAEGHFVNNALPLCVRCNRQKSDRSYRSFFRKDELPRLFERNARATRLLNARFGANPEGRRGASPRAG